MIKKKKFGITLEKITMGNNAAFYHSHAFFSRRVFGFFFHVPCQRVAICSDHLPVLRYSRCANNLSPKPQ